MQNPTGRKESRSLEGLKIGITQIWNRCHLGALGRRFSKKTMK
jgi:hypothetical protein